MDTLLIPLFMGACILFLVLLPALLLYATPVRCAVGYLQEEGCLESTITVSWGRVSIRFSRSGGTSTVRILVGSHGIYSRTDLDEHSRDTEPPFNGGNVSRGDIARYLLPAVRPMGRFGVAVLRQVHIGEVWGKARIGLGDPVSTGMLYGGYWASRFAMNASRIFVTMEPVFGERVMECELLMRLEIRHPLIVFMEAVPLVRNPDLRKLMRAFRPSPGGREK